MKHIPDYVPPDSLNQDRFGTKSTLSNEVKKAGFSKISVKEFIFHHSPGTFTDYWKNYVQYVPTDLKKKIYSLKKSEQEELTDDKI